MIRTIPNQATVRIPTPLRSHTGNQATLEVNGATVGEAMAGLTTAHPTLRKQLFDDSGRLRSVIHLCLNGEDVHELGGMNTVLSPSDQLTMIPAIAGGTAGPQAAPRC